MYVRKIKTDIEGMLAFVEFWRGQRIDSTKTLSRSRRQDMKEIRLMSLC